MGPPGHPEADGRSQQSQKPRLTAHEKKFRSPMNGSIGVGCSAFQSERQVEPSEESQLTTET
jgi:hypothetical protein